jgi:hypothetical protein
MKKQTIVWTALPHGSDGPLAAGTTLHLSVLASPRLWNDDPAVTHMKLSSFPDFLNWPAVVNQATFQVEFEGGATLEAMPENVSLRSDLWQAIFDDETDVLPFIFEDMTAVEVMTFPAATVEGVLKRVYQRAATDDAYEAGRDLPHRSVWPADPDVRNIARESHPARPLKPPPRGDPVVIDEPVVEPESSWWESCCLGCIFWPFSLLRKLLQALLFLALVPLAAVGTGGPARPQRLASSGPGGGGGSSPPPPSPQKTAFDRLHAYLKPTSTVSAKMPDLAEVQDQYDFHQMISALGDYPKLLRYMGLVMDLAVTLDQDLPPATAKLKVIPDLPLQVPTVNYCPATHYELGDGRFLTRPQPVEPEIRGGLLRLHDEDLFRVMQVDVAGGGIKLQNMATNHAAMEDWQTWPANSPEESGLPALQTAGISVVRPGTGLTLQNRFASSYALNAALAAVDGSPMAPPASGDPAPEPKAELWAEDVVRGYRIDVWDDRSQAWHSLCRRIGTYAFPDAPGGPLILNEEEDEGFVQMGATEPLTGTGTRVLRVHETLFTWDGWSLCAPRPGKTILSGEEVAHVPNKAVTQFNMETEFRARPGSLPRLRFGWKYRLRARVVDLAGNSVFGPDDAEFGDTPAEVTPEFKFGRFEPVSPPPLFLREELKAGASLERMVVRSRFDDAPADIQAQKAERHMVPPKTSQLMVERHGLFDGSPGMRTGEADYNLACREAGSLTQKLNLTSGQMEDMDGIQAIESEKGTYYLQTNATFEVAYLPDPFARGVLLLGLPGMASFEEIIEPDGVKANKIPFDKDPWPDYKALRLRLVGLDKNVAPPQPTWGEDERLLTVHLAQGETARVRISSYFYEEDLDKQAVWQWTEEAAPSNLAVLRGGAVGGRNWLCLPFRDLVLVHAVQQPLELPADFEIHAEKELADTMVTLKGSVHVDAKSTAKVEIRATWQDPFDDPSIPGSNPATDVVSRDQRVGEILVGDPTDDVVSIAAMQHALGDTKHHHVTYAPLATTRFREYFDTLEPKELVRPAEGETAASRDLHVLSSARPDAPRLLYTVPTFAWSASRSGDVITRKRRNGGLRVYVERPWYSSGAGELLGVLIRPESVPVDGEVAQMLHKYTSEWGMDPLWPAASTAPLGTKDFVHAKKTGDPLTLAELPGIGEAKVDAVGYEPFYDEERGLWYFDVQLDTGTAYFPFVRLALARFQPWSLQGVELSRVVLADFCQVVPNRTVTYDLSHVADDATVRVKVAGPTYWYPDQVGLDARRMIVGLQQREFTGMEDELGWKAVAAQFLPAMSPAKEGTIWEGSIDVPQPRPQPLRVVVLELEGRSPDEISTREAFMALAESGRAGEAAPAEDKQAAQWRISFADSVELP